MAPTLLMTFLCAFWWIIKRTTCETSPAPCRDIHFSDPVHGHALKGHVIRSINVTNEDWCQIKCYLEGSCMSYNLGPKEDNVQECELSRSDHLQNPQDLIARANFIYRGTENACKSNPCSNNATCQPHFNKEASFQCICPEGSGGKNCEKVPPQLDDNHPENKTLVEGDELVLHCKVDAADPAPNITWKKLGEEGRSFDVGNRLNFTANRTDEGKYRCFAENGIGDIVMSRVATVVVHFPPQLDQHPVSQDITEGDTLVLKCNATGNPTPSIVWSIGADVFPPGETLTIGNANKFNAGIYTCTATNGVPPDAVGTVNLTVNVPPQLDDNYPQDKTLVEGDELVLNCKVDAADPAPNITWKKLDEDGRSFDVGETLKFTANRTDDGKYHCFAENGIGDIVMSRVATVVVHFPPQLDQNPVSQVITEGETLVLNCNATGNPTPSITWTMSAHDLPSGETLTIVNASKSDSGSYTCTATNGVGADAVATVTVTVNVPPHLDDNYPQNKTLVEGDELILYCKVNAADPAPNITWKKLDEDGRSFDVGETLKFTANRTDDGKYRCFAENGISDIVMSRVATVVVHFPPKLDQRPVSQVITAGETVVMRCNATGNPTPSITWSTAHFGVDLPSGETLTIVNASKSDAGSYTCTAANGVVPEEYATVTLTVNDRKGYVSDMPATSCADVLSASPGSENGPYFIANETGSAQQVYCHMDDIPGCGGGGWTLAMKIDGTKSNFEYNSQYWIDKNSFNTNEGKTGFDDQETKMPTYWSTAFNNICVGMKLGDTTNWIKLSYTAASLHSVIADGVYKATSVGRNKWKSLLDDSSLQTECKIEGFNSNASAINVPNPAVVRIGIIADNKDNCVSCNSRLGVGGGGDRAGQEVNPCGNEAVHKELDNGQKHLKAFCYILLQ